MACGQLHLTIPGMYKKPPLNFLLRVGAAIKIIKFKRRDKSDYKNSWVQTVPKPNSQCHLEANVQTALEAPPSPFHPSGSSQCTSPKHPVSCIEPGLDSRFIHDILHVSMPFSQIFPLSPSLTESIRLFYTSLSLLLSCTQGYCYHLSKFHIYALVYCIGVFLSGLLHSV